VLALSKNNSLNRFLALVPALECFLKLFTARARLQIIAKAALPKYDFLS
jgi:hypothetical protein